MRGKLPVTPTEDGVLRGACGRHGYVTRPCHGEGRPGESYIIAGPVHTLTNALEIAARITGIQAPRIHPGPGAMRLMAACMGLIEEILPLPESYTAEGIRVVSGVTYLGTSAKPERELGFKARPLEVGLGETLLHEMQLLSMAAGK